MAQKWTAADIPDQNGKVAVITGANSGLGYEAALALAQKNAQVVMACRDEEKGRAAVELIRKAGGRGDVEVMVLDLADLASVRHFAESFAQRFARLDILLNNAGIMRIPYRSTVDGFEMQFGVNHLGHFALTGLLLPVIIRIAQARVVTVSSFRHRPGRINFADLNAATRYDKDTAYNQAKVANLLFAFELQRKFAEQGIDAISVAAHPGYAATNLQLVGPEMENSRFLHRLMTFANRYIAQSAAMGALPLLYAATARGVVGGEYYGPDGFSEIRGYPARVSSNAESQNHEVARRLWTVSEEMTGIHYPLEESPAHSLVSKDL